MKKNILKVTISTKNGDLVFKEGDIQHLTLVEEIGLIIPYLDFEVALGNVLDIKTLKSRKNLVKVEFNYSDKIIEYEFLTTEMQTTFNTRSATARFFCLPTYFEKLYTSYIRSFPKKKSSEVLQEVVDFTKCTVDYDSDDEMTWLQYNINNIEFMKEVVLHTKTESAVLPLLANKEFKAFDYDKLMQNPPKVTIKSSTWVDKFEIKYGDTLKDVKFSEGVKVNDFKLIADKRISQDVDVKNTQKSGDMATSLNYIYSYNMNFGNTFDDYNSMPLIYKNKRYAIENSMLELHIGDYVMDLEVLDKMKFEMLYNDVLSAEFINGEFLIIGKALMFNKGKKKTLLKITKKD